VTSVNTYLRFAAATDRLDLHAEGGKGLSELVGGGAGERPKWDEASREH
jgi:gas vesicle structural protein